MSGILFVTRKFPPAVGGMETLAAETWRALEEERDTRLLAHRGTNRTLWRWLPGAALTTRRTVRRGDVDCLLLGDTLTASLLVPVLGRDPRPRIVSMAMGLDLTFNGWGYQLLARRGLRACDRVLAISESTASLAVGLGVAPEKVEVVRLGVHAPEVSLYERVAARQALDQLTRGRTIGVPLLGTLGRLVARKGHEWFLRSVLPNLEEAHYVVAGSGPEFTSIHHAAAAAGVTDRVHLLGAVDDDEREIVLRGVDVFVQPNIQVEGDVEGFGLVAIEAAMRGTPVVAARLEGLADAVEHERTGLLVAPADADAWLLALRELLTADEALRDLGHDWSIEARSRYNPEQFGASIRGAVGRAGEA